MTPTIIDNLIGPGSKVKLGDLDVVVTAVMLRGSIIDGKYLVQYEVSWIHSGSHYSKWVEEFEVDVVDDEDKSLSLGFTARGWI